MALKASDVFVVQQATGAQALAKVSAYELAEWVETSGGVHYVGIADFLNAAEEPSNPQIGDLWLNGSTVSGTFAWYRPTGGSLVFPNDKALWNGNYWDILPADADNNYITQVQGAEPITVTAFPAFDKPIVGIRDATTTNSGAVTLATQADLNDLSTTKVVTADQLASVIADLDQLEQDITSLGAGTVTAVLSAAPGDPITITDSTTTPTIAIKDATTLIKGVTQLTPTAVKLTNTTQATTPLYVETHYLSRLDDIDGGTY